MMILKEHHTVMTTFISLHNKTNVIYMLITLYYHVGGASDLHKSAMFLISYIICIMYN